MRRWAWVGAIWAASVAAGWSQPLKVSPPPQSRTDELHPCVQVSWEPGTIQPGSARLWLDGQEVTMTSLRSDDFVSFRPMLESLSGPRTARFAATGSDGTPLEREWSFTVAPSPVIRNLEYPQGASLLENDELLVRFNAPTGGRATFQVANWDPIPMREEQPGSYVGRYQVRSTDNCMSAPLKVSYAGAGQRQEQIAPKPVQLFGGLYKVRVLSPADGSAVDQHFTLRGRARPGSRVSIIPNLGFASVQPSGTLATSAALGSIPADVDEHGNFSVDYGLPILLPNMGAAFTIYSIDPDGTRSAPTTVKYTFK